MIACMKNARFVRLHYVLSLGSFVISENSWAEDRTPFLGGVVFATYDRLIDTILEWHTRSISERALVANKGKQLIRREPMARVLRGHMERAIYHLTKKKCRYLHSGVIGNAIVRPSGAVATAGSAPDDAALDVGTDALVEDEDFAAPEHAEEPAAKAPEAVDESAAAPEAADESVAAPEAVDESAAAPEAVDESAAAPEAVDESTAAPEAVDESAAAPEAVDESSPTSVGHS
jgi:hypothetical protein